jgi:signal transduction histidine kinase
MKNFKIRLILLISMIVLLLIVNVIVNSIIINENRKIYDRKQDINKIQNSLDEIKFIIINVDDLQKQYIANKNDTIKSRVYKLKSEQSRLIETIDNILINSNFYSVELKDLFNEFVKNEENFKLSIQKTGDFTEWVATNPHEIFYFGNILRKIEQILFENRNNLMKVTEYNMVRIKYSDAFFTISTFGMLFVLVWMLIIEHRIREKSLIELKNSNITKDKFFSIISHDLKNPFNTLIGFSQLLLDNIEKYPLEKQRHFINNINRTSKNTYELLSNLLDWSRIQCKKLSPVIEPVNVINLLDEMCLFFNLPTQQKYIQIDKEYRTDRKAMFDKNMLLTVLRNLITNAIKFTNVNGTITLGFDVYDKNYLKIEITDNGVGMNNSQLDQLFRIDSRLTTLGTQGEKGTGLGVILCKELTELCNGKLFVKSSLESGTTFTIILPDANESTI